MRSEHSKFVVDDLAVSYHIPGQGEKQVIKEVSFTVSPGKVGVLLGVNGSGKTTILKAIAGLLVPLRGSITLDDGPPKRREVGYVFQDHRQTLLPWRTVLGNLLLPLEIQDVDSQQRLAKVYDTLDFMEIDFQLDSFPYRLSGGQQQLLALARTLVGSPHLLLLDEPFSALDIERHSTIQKKIASLIERTKITTLIVTHDTNDAILLADEVFVLREGRIAGELVVELGRPRSSDMLDSKLASNYRDQFRAWLS